MPKRLYPDNTLEHNEEFQRDLSRVRQGKFYRPSADCYPALRKALMATMQEFSSLVRERARVIQRYPGSKRPIHPEVLLDIWADRCQHEYAVLNMVRADWLGEVVLGSMVDAMLSCSYDGLGGDARQLEQALGRIMERSLRRDWPRRGVEEE